MFNARSTHSCGMLQSRAEGLQTSGEKIYNESQEKSCGGGTKKSLNMEMLRELLSVKISNGKNNQGCSPRGICLGSRRPRGSFLAGSALPRPHTVLPRSCLGLDLTASASVLPHSFCLGLEGSALPRLGSISQLKRASAHGAQVQVQCYAQRLCLLLEMIMKNF